jgi:hypothetical protein
MSSLDSADLPIVRLPVTDAFVNGHALGPQPSPSTTAPLLERQDHHQPSLFRPENMLREARRQRGLASGRVPPVCVLDPDGDIVRHVCEAAGAVRSEAWGCFHTDLWQWDPLDCLGPPRLGIVGRAVGGSFSVLVAEQLFVSGCELLISIASAGQVLPVDRPPYHVLIERALRDEGTSYHYLPPSEFVSTDPLLLQTADAAFRRVARHVHRGTSWTTDAPFRETAEAVDRRRRQGILTVEMEAGALLAFGRARNKPVLCLAHVTNQLGCAEGDFEKGGNGACSSLALILAIAEQWWNRAA